MKSILRRLNIRTKDDALKLFWQFFKFGIVGISNNLIYLGIYYLLLFAGVHYLLAYACGFVVSVLNAYVWNSRFVFKKRQDVGKSLAKVFISYGIVSLLSLGLLYVMVDLIKVSDKIAPLLILFVTIPLNFLLNKFWAFR